jgi:flap endonuclease-1
MGSVTAYKLMKEYNSIEAILEHIKSRNEDPSKKKKYIIPDSFLYEESRDLFINPDVIRDKELLT